MKTDYRKGKVYSRRRVRWFKKWQSQTELDLPPLVFHALRHSSATYKLLESEGDIKLVQGDLGHSTAKMTVDTYAHTQDQCRRDLTEKIEQDFYADSKRKAEEKSDTFWKLLKDNSELKAAKSSDCTRCRYCGNLWMCANL